MSLVAIRHAPPLTSGVCYGVTNVAVAPFDALETVPNADCIWTSDLTRCREVAHRLGQHLAVDVQVRPELRELDFGVWEGRTWAAIEADDGARLSHWMENWKSARPPGGEGLAELSARIEAWWRSLDPAACHLWIAHAGPMRAVQVLGGMSWDDAMAWKVPYLKAVELPMIRAIGDR
ncbi:MAG: histidine phosphatase family protein [Myxococcota bacterium]